MSKVTLVVAFLSCLCGSEDCTEGYPTIGFFLSCLCGSEGTAGQAGAGVRFLSCLCGSEVQHPAGHR
ncbi:hypothetical protein SAMN05880558_10118 [Aeromonas sp. RU39B]|nr:hypothetical protein SAMN05880558_10118 [Aeromonas sp. RU39B]